MPRTQPLVSLITGGAGFLGSHVCDRLISEGHRVLCLDNFVTGNALNVEHLEMHPRFTLLHHDVTQPIQIPELLSVDGSTNADLELDFIFHFASPASPKDYARLPIPTLKVGALGTYHALGLAKANDAIFILASSSEVYGDPLISPQSEEYYGNVNPIGPRSVYDEAKRFAEALSLAYLHSHGLDVRVARIFNTYGPRMRIDDGRAVPAFLSQAIRCLPITVYGDGSQTRSFCYVDDTIDAIYRLMAYERKVATSDDDVEELVVNIGNPDEVTILEAARELVNVVGGANPVVFEPLPQDDPMVRKPDISRAKELLGWEPKVSRQEGFPKVASYFREQLSKIDDVSLGKNG